MVFKSFSTRRESVAECSRRSRFILPDVGQHEQEGADDDSLQNLPVATEVGHPGHQQLTTQHHKTGHHGHGETPSWQAELNPWQAGQRGEEKSPELFAQGSEKHVNQRGMQPLNEF